MKVYGDSKDFEPLYHSLPRSSTIYKNIQEIIEKLKKDIMPGERIRFKLIPKYYKKRHGIDNAFHVYLPKAMRLIYSITVYEGHKIAFLMELTDHHTYEKRFNY